MSKHKKSTQFLEIYIFFDNDDIKTGFFFIIDFCFKEMYLI